jgi:hypothetical protein
MKAVLVLLLSAAALTAAGPTEDALAGASHLGDLFTVTRGEVTRDGIGFVESTEMRIDIGPGGVLSLGTTLGSISVRTWASDHVRLVVDKRARPMSAEEARRLFEMFLIHARPGGGDVALRARAANNECARAVDVTFTLWVPKDCSVDVSTKSGDIDIPDMSGRFSARTAAGKISVECDTEGMDIEVEDRTDAGAADDTPAASETRLIGS